MIELAMLGNEVARRRRDRRQYPLAHERAMHFVQLYGGEWLERRKIELGEFDGARLSPPVTLAQVAVGLLVRSAVQFAALKQELDPLLVAVVRQQRMVEVEEREDVVTHGSG